MATPSESTAPVMTDEEKKAKFETLPGEIQQAITNLEKLVNVHNADVNIVREFQSDKSDPVKIVQEKIKSGDHNDELLKKMSLEIANLETQLENVWSKAIARANKLNLKGEDVSLEKAVAAHAATKTSSEEIRTQKAALQAISSIFGTDFLQFIPDVDSTRGLRVPGEASSAMTSKPRYSQMFIIEENGDKTLIAKEVETKNGKEMRSSSTLTAQEISGRLGRGHTISGPEITVEFLKSQGLKPNEFDKIESGKEYAWTLNKELKNTDGESLGVKTFNLVFVK